jgi:ABC-type spermidine/putrescine transport system permease subunit I
VDGQHRHPENELADFRARRFALFGMLEGYTPSGSRLGATGHFRQITLPRLLPAIVAAGLLSFTFSLDDCVLPAFTNGQINTLK